MIPPAKLKEQIKEAREARLAICNACELHSKNKKGYKSSRPDEHCTECGCTLSAKTSCLSCECPLKKWIAVMTDEQEDEIDRKFKKI